MFEIIDKVRQKKDREKKIIAFSIAFFICLIIFGFWFFTVFPDFKKQTEIDKKVESVTKGPTDNLSGMIMDNFSQIKKQFNNLKNISDFFEGDTEHYKATTSSQNVATSTLIFSTTTIEKTE